VDLSSHHLIYLHYFSANTNLERLGIQQSTSLDVPTVDITASPTKLKQNINFMRKIPKDAEASIILIGELPDLVS